MSFLTVGQLAPGTPSSIVSPLRPDVSMPAISVTKPAPKFDWSSLRPQTLEVKIPMKPVVPPKSGYEWFLTGGASRKSGPYRWEQRPKDRPPIQVPYRPGYVPTKVVDVGLKPWYKKPAVIVGMAAGGLAVVGGIIWAMRR